jgi:hypothetical protein
VIYVHISIKTFLCIDELQYLKVNFHNIEVVSFFRDNVPLQIFFSASLKMMLYVGMTCSSCVHLIESNLSKIKGEIAIFDKFPVKGAVSRKNE